MKKTTTMPSQHLLFLGDSLIEFCNWQQRFPTAKIRACGRAGETVQGLAARLHENTVDLAPPDAIILMTGTNNVALGDYLFIESYEEIILQLEKKFPKATILVTGLFPFRLPWFDETVIPGINRAIQNMCQRLAPIFLDVHSLVMESQTGRNKNLADYFEADQVHLSKQGYDLWTSAISREITP